MINQAIVSRLKQEAANDIIRINNAFQQGNHLIAGDIYEREDQNQAKELVHRFKVLGTDYIIKATLFYSSSSLKFETYHFVDEFPIAEGKFTVIPELTMNLKVDPRMNAIFVVKLQDKTLFHSNSIGDEYLRAFAEWLTNYETTQMGDNMPDMANLN